MILVQILPSSRFYDPKIFLLEIDLPFFRRIRLNIRDIPLVPISLLVFLPSFCCPLLPTPWLHSFWHLSKLLLVPYYISMSPINIERSSLSRGFSVCVLHSSSSSTSSINTD